MQHFSQIVPRVCTSVLFIILVLCTKSIYKILTIILYYVLLVLLVIRLGHFRASAVCCTPAEIGGPAKANDENKVQLMRHWNELEVDKLGREEDGRMGGWGWEEGGGRGGEKRRGEEWERKGEEGRGGWEEEEGEKGEEGRGGKGGEGRRGEKRYEDSKAVSALQTGFNVQSMRIHESGLYPLPIHFNRVRNTVLPCEFNTM